MLKQVLMLTTAVAATTCAVAQPKSDDWIESASSVDLVTRSFMKYDSLEVSNNELGKPWVGAIWRFNDRNAHSIVLLRMYVSIKDCKSGVGKIYFRGIDGTPQGETDYVTGAGSINVLNADYMCAWVKVMEARGTTKLP